MPLPLFKLAALVAKQISKPLAKILKDKAKTSERFRKYFMLPVANTYHNADITLRMRVLGLGKPDSVPPLTEKAAIELGGDILSEFFVFSVAASLIFLEYYRQSLNAAKKETDAAKKIDILENLAIEMNQKLDATNKRMGELNKFVQDQKSKVEELGNKLNKLDSKSKLKYATQAAQTTDGKQIGKVMFPKSSNKTASSDVTSSMIYQVAEKTAGSIKIF